MSAEPDCRFFASLSAFLFASDFKKWHSSDAIFPGPFIPVTSKLALQWLPCQSPGVVGSAPGLAGAVSVYCG